MQRRTLARYLSTGLACSALPGGLSLAQAPVEFGRVAQAPEPRWFRVTWSTPPTITAKGDYYRIPLEPLEGDSNLLWRASDDGSILWELRLHQLDRPWPEVDGPLAIIFSGRNLRHDLEEWQLRVDFWGTKPQGQTIEPFAMSFTFADENKHPIESDWVIPTINVSCDRNEGLITWWTTPDHPTGTRLRTGRQERVKLIRISASPGKWQHCV